MAVTERDDLEGRLTTDISSLFCMSIKKEREALGNLKVPGFWVIK